MIKQDRNFDTLVTKFKRQIYDSVKGELRLHLLKEDLHRLREGNPLQIWDAGCGFAQVAQWFAEAGHCDHQLLLCDLSKKMLAEAEDNFNAANLSAEFQHGSVQNLAPQLPQFDLIIFHAVLEWLVNPKGTLKRVADKVKPGGYLSLLFYNRNAMVYTNVLKGEWRWKFVIENAYLGKGKGLTPPNPQFPHVVLKWLGDMDFEIEAHTGIRVFHDYLKPEILTSSDENELLTLEKQYCRLPTYRDMGRYIHLLAKKKT